MLKEKTSRQLNVPLHAKHGERRRKKKKNKIKIILILFGS